MKHRTVFGWLIVLNLALVALLAAGWSKDRQTEQPPETRAGSVAPVEGAAERTIGQAPPSSAQKPATLFEAIYSGDPQILVANLRRVGCPEQTVKDIVMAEANRRYRAREEMLRPMPADHVPYGWPARTSEAKLLGRRQQAVALAREKEKLLREALGYDVPVRPPVYAVMTSDQQFEQVLAKLPVEKQTVARQAHEAYWTAVEHLRARTQNFWEAADAAELEKLKAERRAVIDGLLGEAQ